jgi:phosphoglycolate phosphatase/pyrophosphatase PpaX
MLRFPCLVLDHDDTVVQSEATVNYPFFCYILDKFRPGAEITLQDYIKGCYHPGFIEMCRENFGFTQQEQDEEYAGWKAYIQTHIPDPFPGIGEVIQHQKAAGGLVCVVSHSTEETILRDYRTHFGIIPDEIYGWDYPPHQRKPNPYPLTQIMQKYHLFPNDILVVDDMKPAWEMAKNANVPIAFAGWGKQNCPEILREMTSLCDYSFNSVSAFYKFLYQE